MNGFFTFIASGAGRLLRVVAGIAIIAAGLLWIQGTTGWIVAVVGLIPIAAGVFDLCLLAPFARLPFFGRQLREALDQQKQSSFRFRSKQ